MDLKILLKVEKVNMENISWLQLLVDTQKWLLCIKLYTEQLEQAVIVGSSFNAGYLIIPIVL